MMISYVDMKAEFDDVKKEGTVVLGFSIKTEDGQAGVVGTHKLSVEAAQALKAVFEKYFGEHTLIDKEKLTVNRTDTSGESNDQEN